jgi:hypothetical protein
VSYPGSREPVQNNRPIRKMETPTLLGLMLKNPMLLDFMLADAALLAPLYLITIVMPRRYWLLVWTVLLQAALLYKGLAPRGVPCGISGNVLNIPEPQETFQAFSISMLISSLIRMVTLWLRDLRTPILLRIIIHLAGSCLLPFSFFIHRLLLDTLHIDLCFE